MTPRRVLVEGVLSGFLALPDEFRVLVFQHPARLETCCVETFLALGCGAVPRRLRLADVQSATPRPAVVGSSSFSITERMAWAVSS